MSDDVTANPPPNTVGKMIHDLRLQAGMTQGELGGNTFKAPYISAVERGRIKPSQRFLEWCARRLNVSITVFPTAGSQPDAPLPQRQRFAETAYAQANAEMLLASGDVPTAARMLRELRARLGPESSKTLIWLCAYVAYLEGDLGLARQELHAYAGADVSDDAQVESAALHWLRGLIASVEKTYPVAVAEYEQAITASTDSYVSGDLTIEALVSLADTLLRVDDMERAYDEQAKAIDLYEATINPVRRGERIRYLAAKAAAKRDYMRAYRLMKVAEMVYRDVRTMRNIYALYLRHALMPRPATALAQREHDVRQALALARRLEDTPLREMALALLTLIQVERGRLAEARQSLREGLPVGAEDDAAHPPLGRALLLLAQAHLAHAETPAAVAGALEPLSRAASLLTLTLDDAGADHVVARYAYEKAIALYEALGQEKAGIPLLREYGRLRAD